MYAFEPPLPVVVMLKVSQIVNLMVLQIPRQWSIPESVSHLSMTESWPHDIDMADVINGQLAADASCLLLPKYLLLIYQLSL